MSSGDHHFYQLSPQTPAGYTSYGAAFYVWISGGQGRVPLYRFNNPKAGHYYSVESKVPPGYTAEGQEGWVVQGHSTSPKSVPLYHFYNATTDNHYYSTNPAVPGGYVGVGYDFEVFDLPNALGDRVPFYRYFNPSSGKHFYTGDTATPPAGYVAEGIIGYVFRQPGPSLVRLYRYVQTKSGGHYYSTSATVPAGYALEAEQIYIQNQPGVKFGSVAPFNHFYNPKSDDHFYSSDTSAPAGYTAQGSFGWMMIQGVKSGLVPIYVFYMPFHPDQKKTSIWQYVEGGIVGLATGGFVGAGLGVAFSGEAAKIVNGVVQYTVEGPGFIVGLAAAGAALVIAGPGIALTVLALGTVGGNLLVRQRPLRQDEKDKLNTVFAGSLSFDNILITDLSGAGGRPFTIPSVDMKQIVSNLGPAFDSPLTYVRPKSNDVPGQLFFHEMTHAWQIQHSAFLPGLLCKEVKEQIKYTLGSNVYAIHDNDAGKTWSSLGAEQQATVVETWFAEGCKLNNEWYRLVQVVTAGKQPSSAT